ncbi:hypothetical protein MCERH10_02518 [Caulobacteraceae bacterium]
MTVGAGNVKRGRCQSLISRIKVVCGSGPLVYLHYPQIDADGNQFCGPKVTLGHAIFL